MSEAGVGALVASREETAVRGRRRGRRRPARAGGATRDALAREHGEVRVGGEPGRRRHRAAAAATTRRATRSRSPRFSNGRAPDVASWRDLGAFQLLLSVQDDEALRLYCDSVLGPIENGEGEYGGELLESLEAFLEQNGQWEKAARELFCHRHTLRYRIRRIEQLTGRDLSQRARPDRVLARAARRGS